MDEATPLKCSRFPKAEERVHYLHRPEPRDERVADLEAKLAAYRGLYSMFGTPDLTDADFVKAYERVRLGDR